MVIGLINNIFLLFKCLIVYVFLNFCLFKVNWWCFRILLIILKLILCFVNLKCLLMLLRLIMYFIIVIFIINIMYFYIFLNVIVVFILK